MRKRRVLPPGSIQMIPYLWLFMGKEPDDDDNEEQDHRNPCPGDIASAYDDMLFQGGETRP